MARLTKEQFLTQAALPEKEVIVDDEGNTVLIRALTKGQQQELRRKSTLKANSKDGKAGDVSEELLQYNMVRHCMIDPELSDTDILAFRSMQASKFDRVVKGIMELNGLDPEAQQAAATTFP